VRGETVLPAYVPESLDVKAIRERTKMSQGVFAATLDQIAEPLKDWEQGLCAPDSAVRAYLTVIDRQPELVAATLRQAR
jgi:putative transcriptional regulator